MRFFVVLVMTGFVFDVPLASSQTEQRSVVELLSEPITIERECAVANVPIRLRSGKIYLDATINGEAGRFIFDTGSPTVLDKAFGERVGLEVIGENTGRDANGRSVSMDFAQVGSLAVGGAVFRDVPVMIHDYSSVPLGKCFILDGVIGSAILPGSVWRIDTSKMRLQIASIRPKLLPQSKRGLLGSVAETSRRLLYLQKGQSTCQTRTVIRRSGPRL